MSSTLVFAQMPPAQVKVAAVQKQSIEQRQPLVASVEAVTRSTLAAEQGGLVAQRRFDEGQLVESGAVLAQLNTDLAQALLDAAQAAREAASANLVRAKADAENASKELSRVKLLYETSVGSEKEYRDAMTADKVAAAIVTARNAELAERNAEVKRLELVIKKSTIASPLRGVVAGRHVEVGQWLQQGDAVADIVQLDPLFVRVPVPEAQLPSVKIGDKATVIIDALPGRTFTATVAQILPAGDPASRTFPVKLLLDNPDLIIHPGFFARAVFSSTSDVGMVVPKDAVVYQGPAAHVVAVRDGKAVVVPVTVGPSQGGMIAVSGDLKEGDQVAIYGNEALREGQPVVVLNAPPAGATTRPQ